MTETQIQTYEPGTHRNRYSEHVNNADDWRTPPRMFEDLQNYFCDGGRFRMDLAADEHNALCEDFFDKSIDALRCDWPDDGVLFANPPFGRRTTKMWAESFCSKRKDVVAIMPDNISTSWFHDFAVNQCLIHFVRGRVAFLNNEGVRMGGNTTGSIILRYGPSIDPGVSSHVFDSRNW